METVEQFDDEHQCRDVIYDGSLTRVLLVLVTMVKNNAIKFLHELLQGLIEFEIMDNFTATL